MRLSALSLLRLVFTLVVTVCGSGIGAQPATGDAASEVAATATAPRRQWMAVPRVAGRLSARDLGLVINTADPYSVAVGDYNAQQRGIPPEHILRLDLPVRATLNAAEFEVLASRVREHMGPQVQALALAWTQPYAVMALHSTA